MKTRLSALVISGLPQFGCVWKVMPVVPFIKRKVEVYKFLT